MSKSNNKITLYTFAHFFIAILALVIIVTIAFSYPHSNQDVFNMITKIVAILVGGRILIEMGYIALFKRQKRQELLNLKNKTN